MAVAYLHSNKATIVYDRDKISDVNENWFDASYWANAEVLTRGRSRTVAVGKKRQWVLRHYRRGGTLQNLLGDRYVRGLFRRPRPIREFNLSTALKSRDAPVPAPVAARVVIAGLYYRGDILVERLAGTPLSDQVDQLSDAVWETVGRSIRHFHQAGGLHPDLNAHNILVGESAVWIIDLDRARIVKAGAKSQKRNLKRLKRSLYKIGMQATDVCHCWRLLMHGYSSWS